MYGRLQRLTLAAEIYRTHGHRAQESLRPFKGSASEREQIVEARKSQDVGMRVLSRTMGADYELLTTADGIATLVRLRLPAPDPPLFRASAISSLIGAPMPKVLDGTAFGTTRVGTSPLWLHSPFVVIKVSDVFLSVSQSTSVNPVNLNLVFPSRWNLLEPLVTTE